MKTSKVMKTTKKKKGRPTGRTRVADTIRASMREVDAYMRGEKVAGMVVHVPETVDVAAIRQAQGLSQDAFAERFGFSKAAVRDWEQLRRRPERPARILLKIIEREPETVRRILKHV